MKTKLFISTIVLLVTSVASAQEISEADIAKLMAAGKKTEVYEPVPPMVVPAEKLTEAPSDAIILFDGENVEAWRSEDPSQAAGWTVTDGILTVNKQSGGIITKELFTDYQLHIEWKIPETIEGEGQNRGNSGVFLAYLGIKDKFFEQGYELQILDGVNNETYVNGQVGSLYKQGIPLANASKKPGEWQQYDISWKAPRFNEDGSLKSPAYVTVLHNGVIIQNNTAVKGKTLFIGQPFYEKHGAAPIKLQAHLDPSEPISFRNIWLRRL